MPSFDEAEEQDEVDVAVGEFGEAEVEEADEEDDEAEDAMKVRSVISMSLAASCSLPGHDRLSVLHDALALSTGNRNACCEYKQPQKGDKPCGGSHWGGLSESLVAPFQAFSHTPEMENGKCDAASAVP